MGGVAAMNERKRGAAGPVSGLGAGGFSLMELLVAVLVMGVGALGVSALQMVSAQNNRAALMQAEATQLAWDMMDRMRAQAAAGAASLNYPALGIGDAPPRAPDCLGQSCSATQMAAFDQAFWKCSLGGFAEHRNCAALRRRIGLLPAAGQSGLPGGDGAAQVDGNADRMRIRVQWLEQGRLRAIALESRA